MRNRSVNFLVKIPIRCWDINKTRQGITFICRTLYTESQKKRANFETVYLEIIRIDFHEIWQKYSKDSRIEFACFSFRIGVFLNQLFLFQTGHRK